MAKDIRVVANDLKVYYTGFEVAVNKGDIGDAIRYLRDMRRELNDNLDYLESTKEGVAIKEVLRRNLEESLEDYKARVRHLENELKKQ